jgi:hypothetical protein
LIIEEFRREDEELKAMLVSFFFGLSIIQLSAFPPGSMVGLFVFTVVSEDDLICFDGVEYHLHAGDPTFISAALPSELPDVCV